MLMDQLLDIFWNRHTRPARIIGIVTVDAIPQILVDVCAETSSPILNLVIVASWASVPPGAAGPVSSTRILFGVVPADISTQHISPRDHLHERSCAPFQRLTSSPLT